MEKATTYDNFLPHPGVFCQRMRITQANSTGSPSVYNLGLSHASSQASTCIHLFCCSEKTSVQLWSSAFHTQRTRPPTARHSMLKQFAHSPARPCLVCSNAHTSPYLGNLSNAPHSCPEHRYSSTRAAPRAASSGVGGVIPATTVGKPHLGHGGLLTNLKNEFLNHLKHRH